MKLPYSQRLNAKIGLLIILLALPAFVLVLCGNLAQRRLHKAAVQDNIRGVCALVAANEEDVINNARQMLGTLTQFPFLVLPDRPEWPGANFGNLLKLSPDFVNFGLIETNGIL